MQGGSEAGMQRGRAGLGLRCPQDKKCSWLCVQANLSPFTLHPSHFTLNPEP